MPVLNNTKVPKELEKEICDLYLSGIRAFSGIALKYNCSSSNIRNICIRNGVFTPEKRSRIKCDDNYFEIIDSPEKSWLLGLICADGHISKNKCLVLKFNIKDIELLEKVNFLLKSEYKISQNNILDKRTNKIYSHCVLMIYKDKLADDLKKLGIDNTKSEKLNIPEIPEHLLKYYVRGFSDGDGGFYINEKNIIQYKLSTSSVGFLEQIEEYLRNKCDLKKLDIRFDSGCFRLNYTDTYSVQKIFDYLYSDLDNDLYLKRKYLYAKTYFDNSNNGVKTRNYFDNPVSQYQII